ncbi:hypothetical protein F5Y11DRAFT_350664 [Daldinia sp. FL1419]|nr:hypothetical protein F5Y11DRAFT_350664 [Daldinia sp. FL1419]
MSVSSNEKGASPGHLLGLTLRVYANHKNKPGDNEAFSREYLTKVANIKARDGMEVYPQDHDVTVELYFCCFADLDKVCADPYVNMVHTAATLGWVEKHVDVGEVVNIDPDRK